MRGAWGLATALWAAGSLKAFRLFFVPVVQSKGGVLLVYFEVVSPPTCLKITGSSPSFQPSCLVCCLPPPHLWHIVAFPFVGGRVFLGRGSFSTSVCPHIVLKDGVLCRQGRLGGKSPREPACCRVEDGKAKLPVRIAQPLKSKASFCRQGTTVLVLLPRRRDRVLSGSPAPLSDCLFSRCHTTQRTRKCRIDEHWCKECKCAIRRLHCT